MRYKTLRDYGEIGVKFGDLKELGDKKTREFLYTITENTIKRAITYFEMTEGDNIFSYSERQIHTVVCPAIADITQKYMIERPSTRKPKGEEAYSGHVDYWASIGRISYLIELKHAKYAYRQNKPRKSILNRFSRAIQQLNSVRAEEVQNLGYGDDFLFKIALEAVAFRRRISSKEVMDLEADKIRKSFQRLSEVSPLNGAQMHFLWLLDRRLVKPIEYSDCTMIYPAVAFIAKVLP
jgi:uncharacterized protein YbcV (DUF1398 family)